MKVGQPRWDRRFRLSACFLMCAAAALAATPEYTYKIIHVYPPATAPRLQGPGISRRGFLYESTGEEGHSVLRKMKLETGEVVQQIKLAPHLFGEGFTILNHEIVQLTYKTMLGFVYDQATMKEKRTFIYTGEGWSLTNDGAQIYMDDGTAEIRIWDGATLREKKRITVHGDNGFIPQVNELE